jgi:hypothetical protein
MFKINASLLLGYQKKNRAKKKKEMDFQIRELLPLFGPPYHALALQTHYS